MRKFIYAVDFHWGYERVAGHKKPLHDIRAINAMLAFAIDFKPDEFIIGGDGLDCGVISHHNHGKPGATEGLKLLADAQEFRSEVLVPIESLKAKNIYIEGNHEAWLDQLVEVHPSLEGIVELKSLLKLEKWKVIPQGGQYDLGKITFLHGDTVTGGEHVAKQAVFNYERNVRFGHFHTYSVYTKTAPSEYKNGKTGVAVPCLCGKLPKYGKGKPNKWVQGFNFGYVGDGGLYTDYVAVIVDGKFVAPDGKVYKG